MEQMEKGRRVVGANRESLSSKVRAAYENGASIRSLSQELGRSYGFVHGLLKESGVELRARGGAYQRGKAANPSST